MPIELAMCEDILLLDMERLQRYKVSNGLPTFIGILDCNLLPNTKNTTGREGFLRDHGVDKGNALW